VKRILKPSARPFIALGILFALASVPGFYSYFAHGRRPEALQAALLMPALYLVAMALISSVRVSVSDDGVTITRWYILKRFIPFTDVDHSDVQVLAERDWPIQIRIHSRHALLAQLGLKTIQAEDAAWLCSLPQLKCVTHPGLTRRA
jgi:hypothetical protein